MTWLSRSHWLAAQAAISNQNPQEAIQSYCWIVRNYYPGNPYVGSAIRECLHVAEVLEQDRQWYEMRKALKELRASLYAVRSLYQPYKTDLQIIEQRLEKSDASQKAIREKN